MKLSKRKNITIFASTAVLLGAAAALSGSGVQAAGAAKPAPAAAKKQVVTGPVAVYWMNTATTSGMSGMMGGGKPSMSSMMGGMMGGNNASHSMRMELGSSQTTTVEPAADHLPPSGLNVGNDLPLYYKKIQVTTGPSQPDEQAPQDYQPPKGKILIFWGCGEHAPKTQPVVIDLSKLTDPAARAGMMKQMVPSSAITLDSVRPPSPEAWKSYGEWPNKKNSKALNGDSSLVGPHTIKGNYSPDINFTLDQGQDFLAPIEVSGNQKDAAGAVPLTWKAIPASKGFIATAIGGSNDTVVMWTSAEIQTAWMGMAPEYLTANDIERLLVKKALLPGTATTCTVPAEVTAAAEGLIYGITAYGGDTNLSYPPRPTDPNVAWNIQWETKVRYRSATGGILGQDMGGMMGAPSRDEQSSSSSSASGDGKKKKKGSMFGEMIKQGVGSLIP